MPRASWKGFLRLSLVSCPVYLSPATTRTKSIRLNQVWVPRARPAEPVEREENQEDVAPISRGRGVVVAVMFGSFVFTHNEHCIGRFDPEGPTHFARRGALAECIGLCKREAGLCKPRAPLTPEHGKWRPVRVIRNAISIGAHRGRA